jgi:hypothetical protein
LAVALITGGFVLACTCAKQEQEAVITPLLSIFESSGENECTWFRYDPSNSFRFPVAIFDAPCAQHVQVNWSPDLDRAVVGFGLFPKRTWEVDFEDDSMLELPVPGQGNTRIIGYDKQGRIVALTLESSPPIIQEGGSLYCLIGTTRYEVFDKKNTALAHSWYLEEGTFFREETKVTDEGEFGAGITVLSANENLAGVRTEELWNSVHGDADRGELKHKKQLDNLAPKGVGTWDEWETEMGSIAHWMASWDEDTPTAPVAYFRDDQWQILPDLTLDSRNRIAVEIRIPYMLVSTSGSRPHLYDLNGPTLIYASDETTGSMFWPMPPVVEEE